MLSCNAQAQKRIALRYGTFQKASEIQANFMEVVCDNTGNLGTFYKLICLRRAESRSKPGLYIFLPSFWARLGSSNCDSGGRMRETAPSGEINSATSQ